MSDPLFAAMLQSIIDGAPDKAAELAQQALAKGVDPLEAVNRGFAVGIDRSPASNSAAAKCFCPICSRQPRR